MNDDDDVGGCIACHSRPRYRYSWLCTHCYLSVPSGTRSRLNELMGVDYGGFARRDPTPARTLMDERAFERTLEARR